MRVALVLFVLWTTSVAFVSTMADSAAAPSGKHTRAKRWRAPKDLADWNLFVVREGKLVHQPLPGVIPYDLNSPLFSDYTTKYRFVKLPEGTKAKYDPHDVFDFPVGTVIAKTFSYPHDMRDPSKGEQLLETRILYHHDTGWKALTYPWNADQTSATLSVTGDVVPSRWINQDGHEQKNDYVIPDQNKCASCHENDKVVIPVGPKARYLNKNFAYAGGVENQLDHWTKAGILEGAPPDSRSAPKLAVWNDPATGDLDQRARAWLEINCAHCHNAKGPARTSGLELTYDQTDPEKLGVWKTPIAVGRGGGGRRYSIVPGRPDESILLYRIESLDAGVMMPEVARRMIDVEGVDLIRQWIAAMPDPARAIDPAAASKKDDLNP